MPTYVILEDLTIPHFVKELLNIGPNNLIENTADWKTLAIQIEPLLENCDQVLADELRWNIAKSVKKVKNKDIELQKQKVKRAAKWLNDNDIVCARDDKSKVMVLLKRETYNNFINEFLVESKCIRLDHDPTETVEKAVQKILKSKKHPQFLRGAYCKSPKSPRLFAFIKRQKNPLEARPVVEKRSAPTYEMEKRIAKWCTARMKDYKWAITSSVQLIDSLLEVGPLPEEILTVYDFKALYPSIKQEPACLLLYRFFLKHLPEDQCDLSVIRSICHLIVHESYFVFDHKFYIQTSGVPIGSPLAGVLAELIIRNKEEIILPEISHRLKLYKRYIDDVLVISEKCNYINDLEKRFTDESLGLTLVKQRENETQIEYLDINIRLQRGEYILSIFRKNTYVPLFIKADANEPWNFKLAAFRALLNRVNTHCTTTIDKQREIEWIKEQAYKHGYKKRVINKLIKEHTKIKYKRDNDQNNKERKTYTMDINSIALRYKRKLENISGQRIVFNRTNTLFNLIRNDKDRVNIKECPGVYKIPFYDNDNDTEGNYIGYTSRSIKKRLPEHKKDLLNKTANTTLAQRALITNLDVKWENTILLRKEQNPKRGKIAETISIFNSRNRSNKTINKLDSTTINNAWKWCSKRKTN